MFLHAPFTSFRLAALALRGQHPCAAHRFPGAKRLPAKSICPICNRRRAERYCPAKGEKICAVDCGTEREVTIDCPSSCAYLATAHRWEQSHPRPLAESDILFPDVSFDESLLRTRQNVLSAFIFTVLTYAAEQRSLTDADILSAVSALAETYRTLVAGIYYEKPPNNPVAAGLYIVLAKSLTEEKNRAAEHPELPPLKDTEIFHLLVFLARFGQLRSNGRPRSRVFLEFLRSQFPLGPEPAREESRIIMP